MCKCEYTKVWDRLKFKADTEQHYLDSEEREALGELLLDHYQVKLDEATDETLLQMGKDKGVI